MFRISSQVGKLTLRICHFLVTQGTTPMVLASLYPEEDRTVGKCEMGLKGTVSCSTAFD